MARLKSYRSMVDGTTVRAINKKAALEAFNASGRFPKLNQIYYISGKNGFV